MKSRTSQKKLMIVVALGTAFSCVLACPAPIKTTAANSVGRSGSAGPTLMTAQSAQALM